jgi:tetratricopeptide (TPR) repeat protein
VRLEEVAEEAAAQLLVPARYGSDSGAGGGAHKMNRSDLTTCAPGMVWDTKHRKCLMRHSGVLPDPDLTEYAYALAKADRYQEAIDVLDLLDNPNTSRALNYRGYATSKLGRTDEGIGYYLKSVTLDPNYPQVREYVGEAYVIMDNYKFARELLSMIEKLCGKDCEYCGDVAEALAGTHALQSGLGRRAPGRIRRAPALRKSHDVAGAIYSRRGDASG